MANSNLVSTQTLKRKKQARKAKMIECALELFIQQGIENTTMNEVAEAASIGIASAFRYVENKHVLVIETATLLWKNLSDNLLQSLPDHYQNLKGLEQISCLLNLFKSFYVQKPSLFQFLEQFDNYVVSYRLDPSMLEEYESKVLNFKPVFIEALDRGKQDGSIRTQEDSLVLYYTITHQLLALIAKLVMRGQVLPSDEHVSKEAQLDCVIRMIMAYLSHRT